MFVVKKLCLNELGILTNLKKYARIKPESHKQNLFEIIDQFLPGDFRHKFVLGSQNDSFRGFFCIRPFVKHSHRNIFLFMLQFPCNVILVLF